MKAHLEYNITKVVQSVSLIKYRISFGTELLNPNSNVQKPISSKIYKVINYKYIINQ